ncbi:MAG TPA: alkaline phosphatase family protein, partial [Methylomirabilota bacterium]|nr:alkaline phosphatase family protein [Methylomirabilota bacterium]
MKASKLFPIAIAFLAVIPQLFAQSLTNNLIFYTPFNASLNDLQGGRAATSAGGASLQPSGGLSGGYLRLINSAAGAEQYVFYSDPTPATGDFSFQVWVRAANPQNGQPAADPAIACNKDWDSGGIVGWVLAREDAASNQDKFQWNFNTIGGARKDLDPVGNSAATIFDGAWHQLAVTHQRNGNAVFYRDAQVVATVNISANAGQSVRPALGTWITNNILALGEDASLRYDHATTTGVTSLNGDLDEVAMWSRVLTDADVFNAFAKGTNGLGLAATLPPAFVQQPQGGTRFVSETFALSCLVSGDPAPTLQWYKGSNPLPGATNSQLLLTNLALSDAGTYQVVAGNGGNNLTSSPAILIVQSLPPPTGTIADVRHVVIFMQENRSFDHYFGSLKGVRGFGDRNALVFQNKNTSFYQPQNSSYVLPFHTSEQCLSDLNHDWTSGHTAWNLGKWDQWIAAKGSSTMAFHNRTDLAFYYALADAFTICDAYHCSVMGPTNPNRLYLWTGMVDPNGTGGGPVINNSEPAAGFNWTTYPERLQAAGVSWKIYQQSDNFDDNALAWFAQFINAAPGTPLYDRGRATVGDIVTAFQADVTSGALPRVSWLIAPTALSEHPSASPASGELLTKQLLNALASNPAVYNSTVFLLNYDEDDGLFDHVPPPVPPSGTPAEFVNG